MLKSAAKVRYLAAVFVCGTCLGCPGWRRGEVDHDADAGSKGDLGIPYDAIAGTEWAVRAGESAGADAITQTPDAPRSSDAPSRADVAASLDAFVTSDGPNVADGEHCTNRCGVWQECRNGKCTPTYIGTWALSSVRVASVAHGVDGSYVVAGNFRGSVDFDPGPGDATKASGGRDWGFVAKFKSDHTFAWVYTFGGALETSVVYSGVRLAVAAGGSIAVAGPYDGSISFSGATPPPDGGYVLWLTPEGSFARVYTFRPIVEPGVRVPEVEPNAIAFNQDGSLLLGGGYRGKVDFDPQNGGRLENGNGGYVMKLSASGQRQWLALLSSDLVNGRGASVYDLASSPDGDLLALGAFGGTTDLDPGPGQQNVMAAPPSNFSNNMFVVRLGSDGSYRQSWTWTNVRSHPKAISLAADGSFYLVGLFSQSMFDLDPGPQQDVHTNNNEADDSFAIKIAKDGRYAWGRVIAGTSAATYQQVSDVYVVGNDGVVIAGSFDGVVNFGPPDVGNQRDAANGSLFIVRIGAAGDSRWIVTVGQAILDGISIGPAGFIVVGSGGSGDYKPGGGDRLTTSNNAFVGLVMRYGL